ncbi:hypothetical protein GO497_05780 [Acidovorax citrulli]|nr:hypothetical protein [Paracidovorax citrulli]
MDPSLEHGSLLDRRDALLGHELHHQGDGIQGPTQIMPEDAQKNLAPTLALLGVELHRLRHGLVDRPH